MLGREIVECRSSESLDWTAIFLLVVVKDLCNR